MGTGESVELSFRQIMVLVEVGVSVVVTPGSTSLMAYGEFLYVSLGWYAMCRCLSVALVRLMSLLSAVFLLVEML